MSISGANPTENDDAADWLNDFSEEPSIVALNGAFDDILGADEDDYLEVTECAVAVAAGAVIIELYGNQNSKRILESEDLETLQLLEKELRPGARKSLIKRAIKSLKIILLETDRSELAGLMKEEAVLWEQWKGNMLQMIDAFQVIHQDLSRG
jgi:Domain of unknown function (DUF4259)